METDVKRHISGAVYTGDSGNLSPDAWRLFSYYLQEGDVEHASQVGVGTFDSTWGNSAAREVIEWTTRQGNGALPLVMYIMNISIYHDEIKLPCCGVMEM